jgi:chlorite dismutase
MEQKDKAASGEDRRQDGNFAFCKVDPVWRRLADDQKFVLAFESDKPEHFVDLVMELRHSEATSYTVRDTRTFTCIYRELEEVLHVLGG